MPTKAGQKIELHDMTDASLIAAYRVARMNCTTWTNTKDAIGAELTTRLKKGKRITGATLAPRSTFRIRIADIRAALLPQSKVSGTESSISLSKETRELFRDEFITETVSDSLQVSR